MARLGRRTAATTTRSAANEPSPTGPWLVARNSSAEGITRGYAQLFGSEAAWAQGTEAVWELAEHRCVAIEQNPEHAGHAVQTVFVDDFDSRVAEIAR